MSTRLILLVATINLAICTSLTHASTKYWDVNGSLPGANDFSGFADGNWDTSSANWSTQADGTVATTTWLDGDDAVFAAGTDAVDSIVSVPTTRMPNSLTIEDGLVHFAGGAGAITMGNHPIFVRPGATLSIPNQFTITATAGQTLTLDGGTYRNNIVGIGSSLYGGGVASQILLTANGGTIDTPTGNSNAIDGPYSIMVYGSATTASVIGMSPGTVSATLRKTGHGEFRALHDWTFTTLDVQEGMYRINPSGGTETGFGAPTGTVMTRGGAVENTSNGSSLATSLPITSPATRKFVLGGASDTMFVLNATWTINGPISGDGGLMLNGWARNDESGTPNIVGNANQTLTLGGTNTYAGPTTINFGRLAAAGGASIPDTSRVWFSIRSAWGTGTTTTINTAELRVDASETIGSLAGGNASRGLVNLNGAAATLSVGADGTSAAYHGGISGAGSLRKIGAGTQTLGGANIAYTGSTTVEAGVLSLMNPVLADGADVFLTSNGALNLGFNAIDTVSSFYFNGSLQRIGTWGAPGSGAQFTSVLFSGPGILNVTSGVPEPAGLVLVTIGVLALIVGRRR